MLVCYSTINYLIWSGMTFFFKILAASIMKTTVKLIRAKRAFKVYTNLIKI